MTLSRTPPRNGAQEEEGRRISPVLVSLLGAGCISSSAIVVQLAHAGAGTTAFYRCALALPGLIVLAVAEQRRHGSRPIRTRARAALAGGFLGLDLVLWTHSIYDVGAGVSTVLGNLQVLFVTLIAWALFRERPRPRFLLALPVVLVGVLLVSGIAGDAGPGHHPVAGVLYGMGTSVAYAGFIIILRGSTTGAPHIAGPLVDATAGAALASLILGVTLGQLDFAPPLHVLGWLLVLALTSQTVGWLLITASLPRLPAAVSSLLLLLQPAASLVLAAIVLAEQPTRLQLLGAVLVCGGVLIAARARQIGGSSVTAPEPTPG
ncbi:MAG: DMT family transporter [Acidimicrobiales bacterium]